MDIGTIERQDLGDLCALCRMALEHEDLSPEDLEHGLFRDPHPDPKWTLAAREAGRLVGVLHGSWRQKADMPKTGVIKLFGVHPAHRRQGIATALFDQFEALCRDEDVKTIELGSVGPHYFFSGVGPRYTEAVIFLAQRGYAKTSDAFFLGVDLSRPLPEYKELIRKLANSGVTLHRPAHSEMEEVREWVRKTFSDGWAFETEICFRNDLVTVCVARANNALCGFSVSNAAGREFFGPIGVAPEYRRCGLGRALAMKSMDDLQRDGVRVAWIPTGLARIPYYHQAVGARVWRTFWRFAKTLSTETTA